MAWWSAGAGGRRLLFSAGPAESALVMHLGPQAPQIPLGNDAIFRDPFDDMIIL
jgi:hypothetical protein